MDTSKRETEKPVINNATGDWAPNPNIKMVRLTPIEERIKAERPQLAEGMIRLQNILGRIPTISGFLRWLISPAAVRR